MPLTETRKTIGTVVGREDEFGPGVVVSLDFRRASYFRVNGGFMLNRRYPTGRIPAEIDPESMAIIQAAFNKGLLILGKTPVFPEVRPDALEPMLRQMDEAISIVEARPLLMKIMREPRGLRRFTPYDLVNHVIKHEVNTKCRDDLLNYLVQVLNNIPGPTPVQELPQDARVVYIQKEGPLLDPAEKLPDYI